MKISKWESCLLLALLIIPIGGIMYYTKNWNYIPAFISAKSNKYKEVDKTTYAMFCIGMLSVPLGIGLYITLMNNINDYYSKEKVSKNLCNAMQQYRIETSCILCILTVLSLTVLFSHVKGIEGQMKNVYISDGYMILSIVSIGLIWLVHHIVWTRLSDKL
jgi:hypothetical protein